MENKPIRVLFVCLGNICRSPLAEGVFRHQVQTAGLAHRFQIDSAGTAAWHQGKAPDPRMQETAKKRGINISQQRARQLQLSDFTNFDLILAMDRENLRNIKDLAAKAPEPTARIELFRSFEPEAEVKASTQPSAKAATLEVPDPYYGGQEGFEQVFEIVDGTCRGLVRGLVGGVSVSSPE